MARKALLDGDRSFGIDDRRPANAVAEIQVDALRKRERTLRPADLRRGVRPRGAVTIPAHHGRRHLYLDYPVARAKRPTSFHATTPQGHAAPEDLPGATATFPGQIAPPVYATTRKAVIDRVSRRCGGQKANDLRLGSEGIQESRTDGRRGRTRASAGTRPQQHPCKWIRGDESRPHPRCAKYLLDDPAAGCTRCRCESPRIRKSELVHADMSEYKLALVEGRIV